MGGVNRPSPFFTGAGVRPELHRVGHSESAIVVIDDFSGDLEHILAIAENLAPYPSHGNYYPGVRRVITPADTQAERYVVETCEHAGQFIAGAFGISRFDLVEASFSIVTRAPKELSPAQRAPHFDTTDQKHLALLHYLRVPSNSGTAFYRQRSTGIERVTDANVAQFVAVAKREAMMLSPTSGYIQGSDEFFEQIGAVEAAPDRLVIYQGSLLHSGMIPPGMSFSADPAHGRLTANFFVRGH
jgi:hypothetical protein